MAKWTTIVGHHKLPGWWETFNAAKEDQIIFRRLQEQNPVKLSSASIYSSLELKHSNWLKVIWAVIQNNLIPA